MKKFLMFLCAMTLVFGMVGSASAIPYTDTYEPDDPICMEGNIFLGSTDSITWTFDITEDGFNPDTQDVTSASVSLDFSDDSCDWFELAELDVGSNTFYWEVDTGDVSFGITSLMTLSDTGMVDVTLTCLFGDFYFNSATLTAEGTAEGTAPVPEPSTILLMGSGLLGLVGYSRKRFRKKS